MATLPLPYIAFVVPPPCWWNWSLALGCVKEFMHVARALAFLTLTSMSLDTICTLQALHSSYLNSSYSNSVTRKQGFFTRKIGHKVLQMALAWLDKCAILDKSTLTRPLWLGFFGSLFGWFFLLDFFISQQYFDKNHVLFIFK